MKSLRVLLVAAFLLTTLAPPGAAVVGGPDSFGYSFRDSSGPNEIAYNWTDISTSGIRVPIVNSAQTFAIKMNFPFVFYNYNSNTVWAGSNGWLAFSNQSCTNCPAFTTVAPDLPVQSPTNIVAGYWGDLDVTNGTIHYQTIGGPGSRVFILQYTDVAHKTNQSARVTFQFKLFESTNVIQVHYLDAQSGGQVHTLGIEDKTATYFLQYARGDISLQQKAIEYYVENSAPVVKTLTVTPALSHLSTRLSYTLFDSNPGQNLSVKIYWGDGSTTTPYGTPKSGSSNYEYHAYYDAGTYTARVNVTDVLGASSESSVTFEVASSAPNAPRSVFVRDFAGTDVPSGASVCFRAVMSSRDSYNSSSDGPFEVSALFDWGDGSPIHTEANASTSSNNKRYVDGQSAYACHKFANGTYTVQVQGKDDYGQVSPATSIVVQAGNLGPNKPVLTHVAPFGVAGQPMVMPVTVSASDANNDPLCYTVDWDDGTTDTQCGDTSFYHVYATPRNYRITATASDGLATSLRSNALVFTVVGGL